MKALELNFITQKPNQPWFGLWTYTIDSLLSISILILLNLNPKLQTLKNSKLVCLTTISRDHKTINHPLHGQRALVYFKFVQFLLAAYSLSSPSNKILRASFIGQLKLLFKKKKKKCCSPLGTKIGFELLGLGFRSNI